MDSWGLYSVRNCASSVQWSAGGSFWLERKRESRVRQLNFSYEAVFCSIQRYYIYIYKYTCINILLLYDTNTCIHKIMQADSLSHREAGICLIILIFCCRHQHSHAYRKSVHMLEAAAAVQSKNILYSCIVFSMLLLWHIHGRHCA